MTRAKKSHILMEGLSGKSRHISGLATARNLTENGLWLGAGDQAVVPIDGGRSLD